MLYLLPLVLARLLQVTLECKNWALISIFPGGIRQFRLIVLLRAQELAGMLLLRRNSWQAPRLILLPGAVARLISSVLKQVKTVLHPVQMSWRVLLTMTRLKRFGLNWWMLLLILLTRPTTAGHADMHICLLAVPLLIRPIAAEFGSRLPNVPVVRCISVAWLVRNRMCPV